MIPSALILEQYYKQCAQWSFSKGYSIKMGCACRIVYVFLAPTMKHLKKCIYYIIILYNVMRWEDF